MFHERLERVGDFGGVMGIDIERGVAGDLGQVGEHVGHAGLVPISVKIASARR